MVRYLVFLQVEDADAKFSHNKVDFHLQIRGGFAFAGCDIRE